MEITETNEGQAEFAVASELRDRLGKTFYFTFIGYHRNKNGEELRKRFIKIHAEDEGKARKIVFDSIGVKWGFCYDESEFEGQAEKYGLTEIAINDVDVA